MSAKPEPAAGRKIEMEVELDATVEQVWAALTEGEELSRWYPTAARVKPGAGGEVWISFGPGMEGSLPIEVWEPNSHLRLREPKMEIPGLVDSAGATVAFGPYVLDFFLESRAGKTVLRFVHSGFGSGSQWEDEWYDSYANGWPFMFFGLRHYLQRHWGTPRRIVMARRTLAVTPEEAWRRLMGRDGLTAEGSLQGVHAGQRYSIRTATGDRLEGIVDALTSSRFRATVEGLNDAVMGVAVEKCLGPLAVMVGFSTFGVAESEETALQGRWDALLEKLFPENVTQPPMDASCAPGGTEGKADA